MKSLEDVVTCQSKTGTLAIPDDSGNKLLGITTLHDLLRAQLAVAEREDTPR